MGSTTSLLLAVLFGSIGMGYFIYGKKQQHGVALFTGIALCAFPYFISNVFLVVIVGVALMALPYFLRD